MPKFELPKRPTAAQLRQQATKIGERARDAAGRALTAADQRITHPTVPLFYLAPEVLPAQPGVLIRKQSVSTVIDARAWRVLYTTTDAAGQVTIASALFCLPKIQEDSYNLLVYCHQATGIERRCAPSVHDKPALALAGLRQAMQKGWAYLAPDYPGLGAEGIHPFLIGEPTATSVLDAIRAIQTTTVAQINNKTVIWGYSQGGHAAAWAAGVQPSYAPELALDGIILGSPALDPAELFQASEDSPISRVIWALSAVAWSRLTGISLQGAIKPESLAAVRETAKHCFIGAEAIVGLAATDAMGGKPHLINPLHVEPFATMLQENRAPTKLSLPVLVVQGGKDITVPPAQSKLMIAEMQSYGTETTYIEHDRFDHLTGERAVVRDAIPQIESWWS
ncbi:MAG: alpha/beta fold hydrolase [Actinomycetota bacterium]|nr:alpha/beta fold hydrolase [Actinomycetota bacterium]